MKMVQYEKSATRININCHCEIRKKCIGLVHKHLTRRPLTDRYTLLIFDAVDVIKV